MVKIESLIANAKVYQSPHRKSFLPTLGAARPTRYAPLRYPQSTFGLSVVAGILNLAAIAKSGKRRQANIDADCLLTERQRSSLYFASKQSKPAVSFTLDGEGLDGSLDLSVQSDFHPAYMREAQLLSNQSVANPSKRYAVVPQGRTKTRITWLLASLHTSKERLKGQVNALQRAFQGATANLSYIWPQTLDLFYLTVLIEPRDRFTFQSPSIPALLQRRIIKLAAQSKLIVKGFFLSPSGINPITKRLNHGAILP
jgi:hypothetical protein